MFLWLLTLIFFLSNINHHLKLYLICWLICSLLIVFPIPVRMPNSLRTGTFACLINFWIAAFCSSAWYGKHSADVYWVNENFVCVCVVAKLYLTLLWQAYLDTWWPQFFRTALLGYNSHAIQFTIVGFTVPCCKYCKCNLEGYWEINDKLRTWKEV